MKIKTSQLRDAASASYAQYMNAHLEEQKPVKPLPTVAEASANLDAYLKGDYDSLVAPRAISFSELELHENYRRKEKNTSGQSDYKRPQEQLDRAIDAFMNAKAELSPLDKDKIRKGVVDKLADEPEKPKPKNILETIRRVAAIILPTAETTSLREFYHKEEKP